MKRTRLALLCAGLLAVAALPTHGQQTRYNVKSMDFDLWCTEEAHLSYDRCAKRLPEDMQRFEAYRAIVEKYEIPYLQRRQQQVEFDRDILHNDPIDTPPDDKSKASTATDKSPP
ncbi:MAG: hypothetical protein WCA81_08385 [Rhizomicrobium sp.]|jgi:hypothetical protein